jgi:hypothetical protein
MSWSQKPPPVRFYAPTPSPPPPPPPPSDLDFLARAVRQRPSPRRTMHGGGGGAFVGIFFATAAGLIAATIAYVRSPARLSQPNGIEHYEATYLYNQAIEASYSGRNPFGGKTLVVTGEILNVNTDPGGGTAVTLGTPGQSLGVYCVFPVDVSARPDIAVGRKTKIMGECKGFGINVVMRGCQVVY